MAHFGDSHLVTVGGSAAAMRQQLSIGGYSSLQNVGSLYIIFSLLINRFCCQGGRVKN